MDLSPLSFSPLKQCRATSPLFSHQNKGFINYVFCRKWAVTNPAGTLCSLVNKQVVHEPVCHSMGLYMCQCVTPRATKYASVSLHVSLHVSVCHSICHLICHSMFHCVDPCVTSCATPCATPLPLYVSLHVPVCHSMCQCVTPYATQFVTQCSSVSIHV